MVGGTQWHDVFWGRQGHVVVGVSKGILWLGLARAC